MNTQATLEKMHQMKFYGMSRTYQAFLTQKDHEQLTHDNMVAHLVESEWLEGRSVKQTGISGRPGSVIRLRLNR